MNRRTFTQALGLGAASAGMLASAPTRNLKIGHTCITWGSFPRPVDDTTLEPALKDIAAEGFWSYETFPEIIDNWDQRGLLRALMEKHGVPLRSGYITGNLIDPSKRKEEIARVQRLAGVVKKFGGTFVVLAPNGVKRDTYDFKDHRTDIVSALNDYAAAVTDLGLGTGLHQHTGTCIETRDEVYYVMDSANTRNLKFAPDVGQLQKGGADAAKVVKDYVSILKHMHLKDFKGWEHFAGYCPIGQGKVDIASVLDTVEAGGQNPNVMVELDPSKDPPMTPLQTVHATKSYLQSQGYRFRV
ncbi:MAG TPA: sugar phosphate isomerase/epimerase [Bryobacteraceae bacterium]|nr:sugar phosphate isomerase/epimerase [Bryobacteraceae bacterium]